MKRKQLFVAVLACSLVFNTGCGGSEDTTEDTAMPQGTAVEVQEVYAGSMSAEYTLTGKVAAVNEVQIYPLLSGEVTSLPVSEGDYITAGQLLFTVDTDTVTSTQSALQQSYSATQSATNRSIESAQAGVKSAESGVESANTSVSSANNGIVSAQATMDSAQASLESAQASVESAQAQVDAAHASMEAAQAGVESAEASMEAAQAQVDAAQIGVESAQTTLENAQTMFEAGASSQQDVTNAERALRQAEATLTQTQSALKQAEAGKQQAAASAAQAEAGVTQAESGAIQAQSGLQQAEAGVQQAQAALDNAYASSSQAESGLKQAQAGLEQAQAAAGQAQAQQSASLAQIQANLDQIDAQARLGTVSSPCSGIVTKVNLTQGSLASSAQPAVVIAENGEVEIDVSVAEDVFTNIRAGDTAGVNIAVLSDETFTGIIDTLPAAANAQTNLYDVSITLPADVAPPIGAFATVTFYTDRRENTLYVPTEAILTGNNSEQFVFIVGDGEEGDMAIRVPIETGLVSNTNTEIVSGLTPGDRVVVKGQSYLSDGLTVRVVTNETAETTDSEAVETTDAAVSNDTAAAEDTATNIAATEGGVG